MRPGPVIRRSELPSVATIQIDDRGALDSWRPQPDRRQKLAWKRWNAISDPSGETSGFVSQPLAGPCVSCLGGEL